MVGFIWFWFLKRICSYVRIYSVQLSFRKNWFCHQNSWTECILFCSKLIWVYFNQFYFLCFHYPLASLSMSNWFQYKPFQYHKVQFYLKNYADQNRFCRQNQFLRQNTFWYKNTWTESILLTECILLKKNPDELAHCLTRPTLKELPSSKEMYLSILVE